MASPLTVNPSAGDGTIGVNTAGSWTLARGAATGDFVYKVQTFYELANNATNNTLEREFMPFDTSGLGASVTIVSAILYLYTYDAGVVNTDSMAACITTQAQASPTDLAVGDYDSVTTTEVASRVNVADWTNTLGTEHAFTFTSGGRNQINKTGYTYLSLRLSGDLDASAPSGTNLIYACSSRHATSGYRPKLVISYTEGGGSIYKPNNLTLLGVG